MQVDLKQYRETELVKLLEGCEGLLKAKDDRLIACCEKLIELAKGDVYVLAKAYFFLGRFYQNKFDFTTALPNYQQSLIYHEQLHDLPYIGQILHSIGFILHHTGEVADSVSTLRQAIVIFEQIGNIEKMARCYNVIGSSYRSQGQYDEAIEHFTIAFKIFEKNGLIKGLCQAHRHLGHTYIYKGLFAKSLEHFLKSADLLKETNELQDIAITNLSIGLVYREIESNDKALQYYEKALTLFESLQDDLNISITLNNIGEIYLNNKVYDKALVAIERSLAIKKKINQKRGIGVGLLNLGAIWYEKNESNLALDHFQEAFEISERIGHQSGMAEALVKMTKVHIRRGHYEKAIKLLQKALKIVQDINYQPLHPDIYELFSKAYAGLKNYRQAFQYQSLYIEANENLLGENTQKLANIQHAYELELKEKENEILKLKTNELKELDTLKSQFFANISHELRTPLTLVLGPVEALMELHYGELTEQQLQVLRTVRRNGKQLLSLIEEVLDLSKLEATKLELKETEVPFYPYFKRLYHAFESAADLKKIEYQLFYLLDETLTVQLDKKKFEKIVNNLISNAIKYTPKGGKVQISVDETFDSDSIQVKIKDSGKGIHPDDIPHIFDRYYQSKRPNATVDGGTGIGLALAKQFALLFGGELSVQSKLGKGTTFVLTIPKKAVENSIIDFLDKDADRVPAAITPYAAANQENKQLPTVLIVEDNQDMQHFIQSILAPHYNLITTENGRQGLRVLHQPKQTIDLIISDVMMPEMDGFELLEKVKNHPKWLTLPMIMLTARATITDKLKALTIGVDDYMTKPFSPNELLVRIQNLLKNHELRQKQLASSQNLPKASKGKSKTKSQKTGLTVADTKWIRQVEQIVLREIGNKYYSFAHLADEMALSERQVHRKIKQITGLTPNKYLREIRLHQARQLLVSGNYTTISEVAYAIGFEDPHYFSKLYFNRFGRKPISYLN